MRALWISRGTSDRGLITSSGAVPWEKFCAVLTKEPPETSDKTKRGWWTPAKFSGAKNDKGSDRWRGGFEYRDAITLDLDMLKPADVSRVRAAYAKHAYVLHSSYSHTTSAPRLRIVLPLTRSATYDEYQVVSRLLAQRFDIELVDSISYRPVQVTYLPARPPGGPFVAEVHEGAWVDVDATLGELADWRDFGLWPRSAREDARPTQMKAENPLTKRGIVGAFCRTYTVPEAIEKFELPYLPTSHPDRFTYAHGHGLEGAVVYDDGLKLHSHHDTDPGRGQNNAFDLVRLHKFGELDKGIDGDTPISKRPSYKKMAEVVRSDPRVQAERNREYTEDFAEVEELAELGIITEKDLVKEKAKKRTPLGEFKAMLAARLRLVVGQDAKYYDKVHKKLLSADGVIRLLGCEAPISQETGKPYPMKDFLTGPHSKSIPRLTDLGYHPGEDELYTEEDGTTRLNTYVAPDLSVEEPTPEEAELLDDLFDRVLEPFSVARDFVVQSLAYLVQNPGARLPYAIVIAGRQGCGKSTLLEHVPRLLFGTKNVSTPQMSEVSSAFNDWMADRQIISVPELWLADKRDAADRANELKSNLTSPTLRIIPKGLKGYETPNRMSMFASSNYRASVSLQEGDRRWFVHWTEAAPFSEEERQRFYGFLGSYSDETDRGRAVRQHAAAVLRGWLQRVDLSRFRVNAPPPVTAAKLDMAFDSLSEPEAAIREAINDNEPPFKRGVFLLSEIRAILFRAGIRDATDPRIGRWLRQLGGISLGQKRLRTGDARRHRVWTFDRKYENIRESELAAMFDDMAPEGDFDDVS